MSLREKTLKNKQDERRGASSRDRETRRCEAPPPPESVHRTERGDPARESRGARRGSAGLGRGLQKNQGRDHVRQLSSLFQAPLSGDFEGLSVDGAGRFLSGRLLPLVRVLCRGPSLLRASPPAVCEAQGRSSPRAGPTRLWLAAWGRRAAEKERSRRPERLRPLRPGRQAHAPPEAWGPLPLSPSPLLPVSPPSLSAPSPAPHEDDGPHRRPL